MHWSRVVIGVLVVALVCEAQCEYFWHLSDTHMQSDYKKGSDPAKGCYDGKGSAGKFGDYNCRAPFVVERSAMMQIPAMRPKECKDKGPLFVLWTGDAGARRFGKFSREVIEWEMRNITRELLRLQQQLGGVPVYPVIGNHDSYPQHQFPVSNYWVYDVAAELWAPLLPSDALVTLKHGGYYSVLVAPLLRLLVLNTVIYYHSNNVTKNVKTTDPGGQIAWMRTQLANASANGEDVYIASHIPPGMTLDPFHTRFIKPFLDGMRGYHSIIRGSFWGHIHLDMFQLLGDASASSTDFHVAHLASTLGIKTGKNPSFRRYLTDSAKNYTIQDWTTFYMDLPAANKAGKITWRELYSARKFYGIPDATPATMRKFVSNMRRNRKLFDAFWNNEKGGAPQGACVESCRKIQLCRIQYSYPDAYNKCVA